MRISDWCSDVCASDLRIKQRLGERGLCRWRDAEIARGDGWEIERTGRLDPALRCYRYLAHRPPARAIVGGLDSGGESRVVCAVDRHRPRGERRLHRDDERRLRGGLGCGGEVAVGERCRGHRLPRASEIGRASCGERVCEYVEISVVAGSLKNKNKKK